MEVYFEEIYKEYFQRIYTFLYRMCANSSIAEELTQETFYQVFLSLHRFDGESEIYTWLVAIAKHVYTKYLRKNKKALQKMTFESVMETLVSYDEQPDEKIEKEFVERTLRRLVKELPEKYQDVVMLRTYAEMSFAQIAATLKISENSAKVIYCRAKKILTEELKNELKL